MMQKIASLTTLALVALLVGQQSRPSQAWWFSASPTAPSEPAKPQPASIEQGLPRVAVAKFDLDGVKGTVRFSETRPGTTKVDYDLVGLKGNNRLYHVHVRPVPPFDVDAVRNNASAIAKLCGDPTTGGHLNPHHITVKLPPKSAPLDKYELGDLSGKHGPMNPAQGGAGDRYVGSFEDQKLPMSGEHSIVGRSMVIHKNDGARWVCASIEPAT